MAKKKISPEDELQSLRKDIEREVAQWKHIYAHGCQDPFWPDGSNLNMVRNHIIHDKRRMAELCVENDWPLAEEGYIPTPPVVDETYMANLEQRERVARLRKMYSLTTAKTASYDTRQQTLAIDKIKGGLR